jgi:hypothetical protein
MAFGSSAYGALVQVFLGLGVISLAAFGAYRLVAYTTLLILTTALYWNIIYFLMKFFYPELECPCCNY